MADKETKNTKKTVSESSKEPVKKPAAKSAAPAKKETPAAKSTAPAKKEAPAAKSAAPAKTEAPATTTNTEKRAAAARKSAEKQKAVENENLAALQKTLVDKNQTKKTKSGGDNAGAAEAAVKKPNVKLIAIIAASVVLVVCLLLGIILGAKSCSSVSKADGVTVTEYTSKTQVGFASEVLGTVKPVKPVQEVKNESTVFNNVDYPKYGSTLKNVLGEANASKRQTLINESNFLAATGTWNAGSGGGYLWMDKDGYLYNGTTAAPEPVLYTKGDNEGKRRQLYEHSAAAGMYLDGYGGAEPLSDSEPRIIKQMTFRPRGYTRGYNVTGLYAPAGEVIKIQMSEADMEATGGVTIHIGQALYNGKANNIWTGKNQMQRFPVLLNTMNVTKNTATLENGVYTAYVGSFIGGPIYIRNESVTFSATISGGVTYQHFILGHTTKEEFEANAKSTAPYFDMEVWYNGVLHSGPKYYARGFSYDDIYKAAVLWEKVSLVTTTTSKQGIVFLYDPFVAAGAAVAFPGQGSVNCPAGWMRDSLNYMGIINSGSWGNFHEYHHNFQNYGVGDRGEVTNNGLTLVSYSLFTKISSARSVASYGGAGLSGWNSYTSAPWALQRVNTGAIGSTNGLAIYATLLHNLGQDAYMQSTGASGAAWYNKISNYTHQNMSYYADLIKSYGGTYTLAENDYPMFVPVSSVYQTGRSYMYDDVKRDIETMRPYVIPYNQEFTVDLRPYENTKDTNGNDSGQYKCGSVIIGNGFTYEIKSFDASAAKGTFKETETKGVYTYTPDPNSMLSGKIRVTLGIKHKISETETEDTYEGHRLDDVDLILEFEQSHETNKMVLERTAYTFAEGTMYTDAEEAFADWYKKASGSTKFDASNPTQNCNTDIWYYNNDDATREKYPNAPEEWFVHPNTIVETTGKLYFRDKGVYRIYLRGRTNCAVYYSLDGKDGTYKLGATIKQLYKDSANFHPKDANTYFDVKVGEVDKTENLNIAIEIPTDSFLYFKTVLIVQKEPAISYVGLGMSQWTEPMFTMVDKYYDSNGKEVASETAEGYAYTKTHYYNQVGQEVSEQDASNAQLIAPTSASYVNAYRSTYEFPSTDFETEYFYLPKYNYNYAGDPEVIELVTEESKPIATADCNYIAWPIDGNPGAHSIDNLFSNFTYNEETGEAETGIFFSNAWGVSENKPAILAFDLGKEITSNFMTLYLYTANGNKLGNRAFPSIFKLEGSIDGTEYFDIGSWSGVKAPAVSVDLTFAEGKTFTFRYFRLTITASISNFGGRVALNGLTFGYKLSLKGNGANHLSPDDPMFTYKGKWSSENSLATFGHLYVGKKGATMEFEFEGEYLGLLSSKKFGFNVEVTIDGKVIETQTVKKDNNETYVAYLSQKLNEGKHKVTIKCLSESAIDSIIIF